MKKQYLLFAVAFVSFLLASCASKSGNTKNKNYMEGNQSAIDRNVQQLEKRREADEKKIDVSDYEQNKPK